MYIASVGTAVPPYCYSKDEIVAGIKGTWRVAKESLRRVDQLFQTVQVKKKYFILPREQYATLDSFTKTNNIFIEAGLDLAAEACRRALAAAGLEVREVDEIIFTSITGLAVPSMDSRLINRLGMKPTIKRVPIFGWGCAGGAAGIARMHDYLRAYPDHTALLVSLELCSLAIQAEDGSLVNLIASTLFADGAACVVGVGEERKNRGDFKGGIWTQATMSSFYHHSGHIMGWNIGSHGFKIILDQEVPHFVATHVRKDVEGFLDRERLYLTDIKSWVCHPGGPKVLISLEQALNLPRESLELSWKSLQDFGNMSSASVLFILKDTLENKRGEKGTFGILSAMGPGFCSEYVLLRW